MIERLIIHNFKGIKSADISFQAYKNVIVGNNGAGKSTIIEALSLAMGYGLNKLEVTPHLFHIDCIKEFRDTKILEKPRDFDPFGQTGFAHLWLQYD